MGFRYRKTTRLGPFRFTLTHRGLTTSVGAGGLSYKLSGPGRKKKTPEAAPELSGGASSTGGIFVICFGGLLVVVILLAALSGGHSSKLAASSTTPKPQVAVSLLADPPPATDVANPNTVQSNEPTEQGSTNERAIATERVADPIVVLPQLPMREWMSQGGKFSVRARLISAIGDIAYLQKEQANKIIAVPIQKLSAVDEAYVNSQHTDQIIEGKVNGVQEGDLIAIRADNEYRIRLDGIDAPEREQPFFAESRKALFDKINQKQVKVEWKQKTKDGLLLGNVLWDGRWINKELVSEGWAWQHNNSVILLDEEAKARTAQIGIWASDNPIPPWEFKPTPIAEIAQETTIRKSSKSSSSARLSNFGDGGMPAYSPSTSSHRSSHTSGSSGPKTEHVSGYTRKDGTHVRSYTRRSSH
jgi:endonuclease YncB( thermonuclease family)